MNISQNTSRRIFILAHLLIIVFVGVSTLAAQTSSVDSTFNPIISKDRDQFGYAIQPNFTVQPDGKILTYGTFQVVNGVVKTNIVRLNPGGTLDTSFNCTACNFTIGSAVVQPDGKIIVAGFINADGGTSAARLRRLNADGSLDGSFVPSSPFNGNPDFSNSYGATVYAVQPDGKILVVLGGYNSGNNFGDLRRLNTDGTSDTTFTPIQVRSGRLIPTFPTKIFLQPDGKILIALTSTGAVGSASSLNRYNSNGSKDSTFEAPTFAGTSDFGGGYRIYDFERAADGSIIVVGIFNTVNGINRTNIVKLQSAGNVDLSFAPTNIFQTYEAAGGVELFSNGNILVSTIVVTGPGAPTGTTHRFVRYTPNGDVDTTFPLPANLFVITKFVIDSSDSIFLSGTFLENAVLTDKYVRLNTDGSVAASFAVNYGTGRNGLEISCSGGWQSYHRRRFHAGRRSSRDQNSSVKC